MQSQKGIDLTVQLVYPVGSRLSEGSFLKSSRVRENWSLVYTHSHARTHTKEIVKMKEELAVLLY